MTKQQRAARDYTKGDMTLTEIGEKMGVSHVTIRNWLISEGVELRNRGRREGYSYV